MTKLINAPEDVIDDYIAGLVASSPHLARLDDAPVVVRAERKRSDRVALVSGGGSGHEPAHAGYVGTGMLDAAVLGPVFTSPSVDDVYAAIHAVATDAGVLLVVKNYTGDRLNFGLAADMARADGIAVEQVVVADDAALGDASGAGRRGLTATVLAHKAAGAAAERGASLAEVVAVAERLLARAATMGVALGACTVPGSATANFELGDGEVEWGLGIHGEPGRRRGAAVGAAETAEILVDEAWRAIGGAEGESVVALVNSLGGTPDLELRILQGDVLGALARRGAVVRATWAGPFLTSLEMPGASVTVAAVDDALLTLLTDEAAVAAFPRRTEAHVGPRSRPSGAPARDEEAGDEPTEAGARAFAIVAAACRAALAAEPELTDLDRRVGDGDMGTNLARGAQEILDAEAELSSAPDAAVLLRRASAIARRVIGGTSGPLYSALLLGMAEELARTGDAAAAFAHGASRVRAIGGAEPGDRTMVDALAPAADAIRSGGDLAAAAAAARAGADATARTAASLGRSSYLGDRAIGTPDPGAVAVALLLEALAA
ncbi:MAG: dihydroxyacetone kinase family protein [Microbacterium sp.]